MPETCDLATIRDRRERSPRSNKDPWQDAARKERLELFRAEIEKHLAIQVADAAEQFKATAEKIAASSQASFITHITNITAKLTERQDHVENDI
eukprot:4683911-Pyramimonas_sp.AAC.1